VASPTHLKINDKFEWTHSVRTAVHIKIVIQKLT